MDWFLLAVLRVRLNQYVWPGHHYRPDVLQSHVNEQQTLTSVLSEWGSVTINPLLNDLTIERRIDLVSLLAKRSRAWLKTRVFLGPLGKVASILKPLYHLTFGNMLILHVFSSVFVQTEPIFLMLKCFFAVICCREASHKKFISFLKFLFLFKAAYILHLIALVSTKHMCANSLLKPQAFHTSPGQLFFSALTQRWLASFHIWPDRATEKVQGNSPPDH